MFTQCLEKSLAWKQADWEEEDDEKIGEYRSHKATVSVKWVMRPEVIVTNNVQNVWDMNILNSNTSITVPRAYVKMHVSSQIVVFQERREHRLEQ